MNASQRIDLEEALQHVRGRRFDQPIELRHLKALHENGQMWADIACALTRRIDQMDMQAERVLAVAKAERMKAS